MSSERLYGLLSKWHYSKNQKTIAQKGFHNSDQQVKQDKSTLKGKEKEKWMETAGWLHFTRINVLKLTICNFTSHFIFGDDQIFGNGLFLIIFVFISHYFLVNQVLDSRKIGKRVPQLPQTHETWPAAFFFRKKGLLSGIRVTGPRSRLLNVTIRFFLNFLKTIRINSISIIIWCRNLLTRRTFERFVWNFIEVISIN